MKGNGESPLTILGGGLHPTGLPSRTSNALSAIVRLSGTLGVIRLTRLLRE
jgi:hypothetical protein